MKLHTSRMETHYLERYREVGGRAEIEPFEGSGHFPPIDAAERWSETFFGFLASVEP
jgi:hypothetical protein